VKPIEIRMQEMTWPEVKQAMQQGADTVIIVPTSQEQHGPHLPLATDFLWGQEIALRVGRSLNGRALLAPVIPFGPNEEMMGFPGTISLRKETMLALLRDICISYARHGFKHAVLFSSHEGDFDALADVGKNFQDIGINVIAFDDLDGLLSVIRQVADKHGISYEAVGGHSGEFETSIMLAAYPEKVRFDRAETGILVDLDGQPNFFRQDLSKITPNGIVGDAQASTREQGEAYWHALTEFLLQFILEHIEA
jgi:creatinine amidohydrolase